MQSKQHTGAWLDWLKDGAFFLGSAALALWVVGYSDRLFSRDRNTHHPGASGARILPEDRDRYPEARAPIEWRPPAPVMQTMPVQLPETLSAFQQARLQDPEKVGHLNSQLILSLRAPYSEALQCYSGPDRSVLLFQYRVRAHGLMAKVLGSRFAGVKSGAPVDSRVIDCVSRALNRPSEIHADRDDPFPDTLEAEIPVEIALEGLSADARP